MLWSGNLGLKMGVSKMAHTQYAHIYMEVAPRGHSVLVRCPRKFTICTPDPARHRKFATRTSPAGAAREIRRTAPAGVPGPARTPVTLLNVHTRSPATPACERIRPDHSRRRRRIPTGETVWWRYGSVSRKSRKLCYRI